MRRRIGPRNSDLTRVDVSTERSLTCHCLPTTKGIKISQKCKASSFTTNVLSKLPCILKNCSLLHICLKKERKKDKKEHQLPCSNKTLLCLLNNIYCKKLKDKLPCHCKKKKKSNAQRN